MIICGDALTELRKLPNESVNMCVTSPPYWGLRDYGVPGQLGLEKTPEEYVARMVEIFREVRRVLRKDGTLWLNLGDSYAGGGRGDGAGECKQKTNVGSLGFAPQKPPLGLKPKDLVGIPWRVALALQADGWWLRQDIIWFKKNPMPESVRDRCTKAHEYLFTFAKNGKTILWQAKDTLEWSHKPDLSEILGHNEKGKPIKRWLGFSYYYDAEAVKEPAIYREDERPFGSAGGNRHGDEGKIYKPLYKDARSYSGKHSDKQRGHGRRHAGFNERWDAMSKEEQCGSMRNLRSVWAIATRPYAETHFATFPPEIPERCIKAGCPKGGTVLDPFFGAGTTGLVAMRLGREFIGIELNLAYCEMARKRIYGTLVQEQDNSHL